MLLFWEFEISELPGLDKKTSSAFRIGSPLAKPDCLFKVLLNNKIGHVTYGEWCLGNSV